MKHGKAISCVLFSMLQHVILLFCRLHMDNHWRHMSISLQQGGSKKVHLCSLQEKLRAPANTNLVHSSSTPSASAISAPLSFLSPPGPRIAVLRGSWHGLVDTTTNSKPLALLFPPVFLFWRNTKGSSAMVPSFQWAHRWLRERGRDSEIKW